MELLMMMMKRVLLFWFLVLLIIISLGGFLPCQAEIHNYTFIIKEVPFTRLCSTKNILTVNGEFPGPALYLQQGDTAIIHIKNEANENITIHWHGVKQPRNPWADGPEYITQCPIMPGNSFTQTVELSDEIGTLWWHAHSDWSRATVHGLIVIYPKTGDQYPFPQPHAEVPIILGEWWKSGFQAIIDEIERFGGASNVSDAFLINGQPGDLYPCSQPDTFKLSVEYGNTYLLRIVNTAMNNNLFFAIAKHQITVVGLDGSYVKPFKMDYIFIAPGQSMDVLLQANQAPDHYYMGAKVSSSSYAPFDNSITTGIIQYLGNYIPSSSPNLPNLPLSTDTKAANLFTASLRSLSSKVDVPTNVDTKLFFALSINFRPCETDQSCTLFHDHPNQRLTASINNMSFVETGIDVLQAYHKCLSGVIGYNFPSDPHFKFNFTGKGLDLSQFIPAQSTKVKVLEYGSNVEIVLQGTSVVTGLDHPMHLHGHSFYVVGSGDGNFDEEKDPLNYNLVDPPLMNTVAIPKNGWATIRFKADNPGVWLMHCHFELHAGWGMKMAFVVKDGMGLEEKMLPPPPDMPPC